MLDTLSGTSASPAGGRRGAAASTHKVGVHFFSQPALSGLDALFVRHGDHSDYYTMPMIRLRAMLEALGAELHTADVLFGGDCDAMVVIDLPAREDELAGLKRRFAGVRRWILVRMESPIVNRALLARNVDRHFDRVITYASDAHGDGRTLRYCLPVLDHCADLTVPRDGEMPFAARKPLLMINSNRRHGWTDFRNLFMPRLNGWRIDWRAQFGVVGRGDGYAARRRLARTAAEELKSGLDIYGYGWRGEPITWWNRIVANRTFCGARGVWRAGNVELMSRYRFVLAYENWIGSSGYISEKLFLPMVAGAVPVYLGARDVERHVPKACFVDRRDFACDRAMVSYLSGCGEAEWDGYRRAGAAFLRSPAARAFHADSLAAAMATALGLNDGAEAARDRSGK
jgi:hypothetical protein